MSRKLFKMIYLCLATLGTIFSASLVTSAPQKITSLPLMRVLTMNGGLNDHVQGKVNAPVTIIEYASPTCHHCATFFLKIYPEIKKKYVDTGKVKFIFREAVFDYFSLGAAAISRCAGENKFFPVIGDFFTNQMQWLGNGGENAGEYLFTVANRHGLDRKAVEACFSNKKLMDSLAAATRSFLEDFGIEGTPAFIINGDVYLGMLTVADLSKLIDERLRAKSKK